MFEGLGFRVESLGSGAQGSGFRSQGSEFLISGLASSAEEHITHSSR